MNETTLQQEPSGLERFSHLEDKIFRLVEEFKAVRRENDSTLTFSRSRRRTKSGLEVKKLSIKRGRLASSVVVIILLICLESVGSAI